MAASSGHMPAITGVRGAAALLIVVFHMYAELSGWARNSYSLPGLRFGWVGVDLFFVMSGFLLAWVLWSRPAGRKRDSYGSYVAQRSLRILPVYYVALLATLVMIGGLAFIVERPVSFLLHLLLLQMFDPTSFAAVNPLFWTLAVELQFYLLLPFLLPLFAARRWPYALAGALALTLAWRYWFFTPDTLLYMFYLPAFLFHFAVGVVVARFVIDGRRPRAPALTAALAFVLLVAAPLVIGVPQRAGLIQAYNSLGANLLVRPLVATGFAMIVWAAWTPSLLQKALSWRPMVWSGNWSYSLYLIHIPILLQFRHFPSLYQGAPWLYLLLGTAASVMGGILLYRLVESPVNRLRYRIRERPRRPVERRDPMPVPQPVATLAQAEGSAS